MATTILAGLWTRPSTSTLNRGPEANLPHLRSAMSMLDKRIKAEGLTQSGMKGLFVAPEYYFAKAESGTWDATNVQYRTRTIEQRTKDVIVEGLKKISADFPGIVLVPGTIAWRKPLDRTGRDQYKLDKLTGVRTNTLKPGSRRTKNFARVASVGDLGMGGGVKGTDEFYDAVDDMITNNVSNCGTVFNNRKLGGMSDADAFRSICGDWGGNSGRLAALAGHYGFDVKNVNVIPSTGDKLGVQATATYMMRNTAYLIYNGKIRFKYNKTGDFHESIGDSANTVFIPGDKLGLSDPIEGVTFGLEICLDHALGVLNSGFPVGKSAPHIHIVVSDHVANDQANMRARKYFVHASTSSSAKGVWKTSGGIASEAPLPRPDTVDGGTIDYWKLSLVEASTMV